jgi:hypothetical protein
MDFGAIFKLVRIILPKKSGLLPTFKNGFGQEKQRSYVVCG